MYLLFRKVTEVDNDVGSPADLASLALIQGVFGTLVLGDSCCV